MPFSGPLHTLWGDAMSARALQATLVDPARALGTPPAADTVFWDRADRPTLDAVIDAARSTVGAPWPVPLATDYARYVRDGDRATYETQVFARQARIGMTVVAAAATRDPAFLTDAANGLIALAEQSSWCWPAHDDTWARHGSVIPTVTDPFLDLGAGEALALVTWADHLLGSELDATYPGVRARLRHEADARVFEPFLARRDWHWIGRDGHVHNWNPWIHSNVIAGAVHLIDDPERRAAVVATAIADLDRYVAALPLDGAIDEGYAYWWNGAARLLETLETLEIATAGALQAHDIPAVRETISFPHRMHLGGPWYVNFADGEARPPADKAWRTPFHWATVTGNEAARQHAASYRNPAGPVCPLSDLTGSVGPTTLGRLTRALADADWCATIPATPPLIEHIWLPSVEVTVARQQAGSPRGWAFAAKGGNNDENHNHNDIGSFILAAEGVPVVIDIGRPTYTAQTFGPDRYSIWTMQSQWHNTPLPAGVQQPAGRQYVARWVRESDEATHATFTVELAEAYPAGTVDSWVRSIDLDRAGGRVAVTDTWHAVHPENSQPTRVYLILAARDEPHISAGRVDLTPLDPAIRPVHLTWDPAHAEGAIEAVTIDDPLVSEVWGPTLWRLTLTVPSGSQADGSLTVQAATSAA